MGKALHYAGIILATFRRVLTAHIVFGDADSKLGGSNMICLCCCYNLVVERKKNSG